MGKALDAWKRDTIDTTTAAALLGVTRQYVANMCKRGDLGAVQTGREWAVYRRDVEKRAAIKAKAAQARATRKGKP